MLLTLHLQDLQLDNVGVFVKIHALDYQINNVPP